MILIDLIVKFMAVVMLSLAAIAATTALLGNRIRAIQLFMGPVVFEARFRHLHIRVGLLPLGGFIEPVKAPYDEWGFWKSAVSSLSGVAALLIISVVVVGPDHTIGRLLTNAVKLLLGAFSPLAVGKYCVADGISFLSSASPMESLAGIAVLFASFNLLPIPALPVGTLLLRLVAKAGELSPALVERIMVTGAMISLMGWILWLVAAVTWLFTK